MKLSYTLSDSETGLSRSYYVGVTLAVAENRPKVTQLDIDLSEFTRC